MADIAVANTSSALSGKTLLLGDTDATITALHTFSRSSSAPFAVNTGAGNVANLDADKLDGLDGAAYATRTGSETLTNKTLTSPAISDPTISGTATLSGGKIAFPSTQSASADANTLDDYEEGTYTPTWSASGGSPLPSIGNGTLTGTYIKIGQFVMVSVYLLGGSTTVWGTTADAWTMSLPFQAGALSTGFYGSGVAGDAGVAIYPLVVTCAPNASTVRFVKTTTAVPGNFVSNDPFAWGTGDTLQWTLCYRCTA